MKTFCPCGTRIKTTGAEVCPGHFMLVPQSVRDRIKHAKTETERAAVHEEIRRGIAELVRRKRKI